MITKGVKSIFNFKQLEMLKEIGIVLSDAKDYTDDELDGIYDKITDHYQVAAFENGDPLPKSTNVLGFFTLENGKKIISAAWQRENYLGIPEMKIGTEVILTYKKAFNSKCYLNKVERR